MTETAWLPHWQQQGKIKTLEHTCRQEILLHV